ncbi:MAG: hypothetical protein DRR16_20265 [Candidatus Parabeggiatoa sp. nov. 3]|nr:MAG: hypothetical protein DRR16_20265 [Gammaproteobacteria bacterium]
MFHDGFMSRLLITQETQETQETLRFLLIKECLLRLLRLLRLFFLIEFFNSNTTLFGYIFVTQLFCNKIAFKLRKTQ